MQTVQTADCRPCKLCRLSTFFPYCYDILNFFYFFFYVDLHLQALAVVPLWLSEESLNIIKHFKKSFEMIRLQVITVFTWVLQFLTLEILKLWVECWSFFKMGYITIDVPEDNGNELYLYFSWKLSYLAKIWSSYEIFSPLSEKHNFNLGKPLKNKSLFRCKPCIGRL